MSLVDHVEELIAGKRKELEPGSSSRIGRIRDALQALTTTNSSRLQDKGEEAGGIGVLKPFLDTEGTQSQSFWSDVLQWAQREDQSRSNSGDAVAFASSNTTAILLQQLSTISAGDEGVYTSLLSDVRAILTKNDVSDDQASAMLAEALGFDQLDLVTSLVQERKKICAELKPEDRLSTRSEREPVPKGSVISAFTKGQLQSHARDGPSRLSAMAISKPYIPGSSMVIQSQEEINEAKRIRAEQRKLDRARIPAPDGADMIYSAEEKAMLRAQSLEAASSRPLFNSDRIISSEPIYPHVFASQGGGGSVLSAFGAKFSLPLGTTRLDHDFYEEVTIPPPKQLPLRSKERLTPISEMDALARGAFHGYASLNRLQSAVYPLGYGSNENLLVCAPTGAGKTDVAMLTVLRTIKMHARTQDPTLGQDFGIRLNDFKIIYVAPMKALASEIVAKFSKRLRYLGVKVRELTGDMQLTRQEIAETQMIVTTPEKWDVVTRKPSGEGELATKVRLLIIDEVHLLHEDRGAVIETIVARTLRLVESSQSLIRIVGLSATLPNYVDVADFLRVNRYQGLFFFDSSFRPVPLEQHFLGVQGKVNSAQSRLNHDKATFEKLSLLIEQGHQMMIFVHARKDTVKTATTMREMCKEEGLLDYLARAREDGSMAGKVNGFRRDVMESRNRELKELFETGFGIHHAGMLRKDRNLSERLFESGVTRVLCCTSTLAWGVNLPAYAVLIKGTDVYDSSLGRFSDLSILDVLQIFGRAGRPQYERVGVGYIITSQDKLSHYVDAITSQHPIESKFKTGIIDALNAEVALGSVSSVADGVNWLSYTYLFTRMKRNPLAYGMLGDEVADDPQLGARRHMEITTAAKYLAMCKMMQFDSDTGQFTITELGRIAAKYYISYKTIEIFNAKLKSQMTEADILAVFGQGTDFEQIIPRETEVQELKALEAKVPCQIVGACETSSGKTNLLLQAYISRLYIEDFALVSDSGYVAQNAGRVMRALLEIALSNRWANTSTALLGLTKAVERRLWPFDHPLDANQSGLKPDIVYQLKRWADDAEIGQLARMDKEQLASLCKLNARHAEAIRDAARAFPMLSIGYDLRPVTHDLLSVVVRIVREFDWKDNRLSTIEPFLVWIENDDGTEILQWKRVLLRQQTTEVEVTFLVDTLSTSSNGLGIRWSSDKWLGSEDLIQISFENLIMPPVPVEPKPLLDLPLLSVASCVKVLGREAADAYATGSITALNSLQTQSFHIFVHSQANAFICAPTRSGKTTLAHMAIWRTLHREMDTKQGCVVLAIYPNASLASQGYEGFPCSKRKQAGLTMKYLWKNTADFSVVISEQPSTVVFASCSALLEAMSNPQSAWISRLRLVVLEDLYCWSCAYELAVCQLLRATHGRFVRFIATSTSLVHTEEVQHWLRVKNEHVFNFKVTNRPCSLKTNVVTFDLPHSLNLLKVMVKPAYDRIKIAGSKTRAIVFVPSRAQAFSTASDLVTRSASELDTEAFLGVHPTALEPYLYELSDPPLREPLRSGIGIIHDGVKPRDRALILSLYDSRAINLLIANRDSIWSLRVACDVVIVMGLQFYRSQSADILTLSDKTRAGGRSSTFDGKLVDYPISDLVRMQSFAAAASTTATSNGQSNATECVIMCQEDQALFVRRMLEEGCIIESSLLEEGRDRMMLLWCLLQEWNSRRIRTVKDVVTFCAWSFACRQMKINPCFYGSHGVGEDEVSERLSQLADEVIEQLVAMHCLQQDKQGLEISWKVTEMGQRAASNRVLLFSLYLLIELYRNSPTTCAASLTSRHISGMDDREEAIISDQATLAVLTATRDCLAGEYLDRFNLPRASRKKRDTIESQQAESSKAQTWTVVQMRALLWCVLLTSGAEIRTPDEVLAIRSAGKMGKNNESPLQTGWIAALEKGAIDARRKELKNLMYIQVEKLSANQKARTR